MDFKAMIPSYLYLPFPRISVYPCAIRLSNLYRTDWMYEAARQSLTEAIGSKFEAALNDCKRLKSVDLYLDAVDKKSLIKNIAIEYGLPLESADDLKLIIATLPEYSNLRAMMSNIEFIGHKTKRSDEDMKKRLNLPLGNENNASLPISTNEFSSPVNGKKSGLDDVTEEPKDGGDVPNNSPDNSGSDDNE